MIDTQPNPESREPTSTQPAKTGLGSVGAVVGGVLGKTRRMNRTFKIKLKRGIHTALYLLEYSRNERADLERIGGDAEQFVRKTGDPINFSDVHMDKLAFTVQEWAAETDAEGETRDITGLTPSF